MITKAEFKNTIKGKIVEVGTWDQVDKVAFDANPEPYWDNLRDRIKFERKENYKNFRDGRKEVKDLNEHYGIKKPSNKYIIGMVMGCYFKDYKSYLREQRKAVVGLLNDLNKALGIRGVVQ